MKNKDNDREIVEIARTLAILDDEKYKDYSWARKQAKIYKLELVRKLEEELFKNQF